MAPPTLEVSDNNLGISGVQRILAVHDFALAMVGSAHLVCLKSYSSKFLQLLPQRYEPASGLRPPSLLEAQQGGFGEQGKGQGKEKGQKCKGSLKGASSSWVKHV